MSHTTTLKGVQIKDIAALRAAVAELITQGVNCALLENAKPRMFYASQHTNCDYVLNLKDSQYDVGFDKQKDGSYAPVFDEWSNHVSAKIGASCPLPTTAEGKAQHQIGKLLQSYQKHVAINAAVMSGYSVESADYDKEGNLQLVINA
ncbi:hypothetical protein CC53_gp052 [Rhizobium phage vB_RleS_L338C]|uniref:hypothetical protein n=1 Tax=Rhizobium phage vB_RleS_L338C TaxID=1414737 RepID=UPI0003D86C2A|nr:hypothetical protein CC53_gp052 [Rhizobium phage vB_RleS_L338C]AHC30469.1 hypothetical protein L338C_052 [Rhizobium phage vB_RleS_L338C]QNH72109.1 hypothetical protein P11VFA_092 [Rhizobium phage P11VFA]